MKKETDENIVKDSMDEFESIVENLENMYKKVLRNQIKADSVNFESISFMLSIMGLNQRINTWGKCLQSELKECKEWKS